MNHTPPKGIIILILAFIMESLSTKRVSVDVFHYISIDMGLGYSGRQHCEHQRWLKCTWQSSPNITVLGDKLKRKERKFPDSKFISLSLYNIHSWYKDKATTRPDTCALPTHYNMFTSAEAHTRYSNVFQYENFDGYSTMQPHSSVPIVYGPALRNFSELQPIPFSQLIKGAAFVASESHSFKGSFNRNGVVLESRKLGIRVDGLGRALNTANIPEGVDIQDIKKQLLMKYPTRSIPVGSSMRIGPNDLSKLLAIRRYMFYFAFENTIESGYVTEKPFDGVFAGVVTVYAGDADRLKELLGTPKGVIYLADFKYNVTALAEYLNHLQNDEQAYEALRAWRKTYDHSRHLKSPALRVSWPCAVCEWAAERAKNDSVSPLPTKKATVC